MPKKILVIDDEADVMKVVVYRLKAKGYVVATAVSGEEGVAAAAASKPDLIILDFRLPDLASTEITERFRRDGKNQETPVILVTASVEKISVKAKECGAVDSIAKPIDPEELYAKIERWLGI
ncbi:MAG: response regulator [Candidatus Omnitrophota bacterium]